MRTYVDDFQESKSFDKGYWHSENVTDRDRKYLSKTHDRQSLTFKGRRKMREYMSTWLTVSSVRSADTPLRKRAPAGY